MVSYTQEKKRGKREGRQGVSKGGKKRKGEYP